MPSLTLPHLSALDSAAIDRFRADGFLVVENVLNPDQIATLRERFPQLFAGQFDTGVYPDVASVVAQLHAKCPSGGTYSFDPNTNVVSCSVHGHP